MTTSLETVVLIGGEVFGDHLTPPGHPERVERAEVMDVVADAFRSRGGTVMAPRAATRDELLRVHTARHLDTIAGTSGRAVALDPDTFTSPESHAVALLAAGAALQAVELVVEGSARRALCLVRPPGHHAESARAMGFCLYNNAAAAAAHAIARGFSRVAIVDYDVHHGNGTQEIFYRDPRVLYVSTHQFPYYPGTGAAGEVGLGSGAGKTVNIPLDAGATDGDYALVFEKVVVPVLDQFKPELVIVSAGFDAHERDPLGGMRMSDAGFRHLNRELCRVADACSGGRLMAVTEGGYDLRALAACLTGTIETLAGDGVPDGDEMLGPTARSRDAIAKVVEAQRRYWRL